jgi:hypothetical protein
MDVPTEYVGKSIKAYLSRNLIGPTTLEGFNLTGPITQKWAGGRLVHENVLSGRDDQSGTPEELL